MRSEKGSALLIVFVFAAAIAIMLYKEMPVATFEAQRQKEQLLIDRGNEYKRAVKLYVRKFQTFPPSIEALENTNRMRFLRNRYVDPYTGKAEWRLLHAGPGGIIMDSKIKNVLNGAPGAPGAPSNVNGSSSFGSNGSSFGSSGFANSNGSSAGFASSNANNSGFGNANAGNSNGFNNPTIMDNGMANLGMNGANGPPGSSPFPQRRPAMALNPANPTPDQSANNGALLVDAQSSDPLVSNQPVPGSAGVPNPQLGMQDPQTLAQNFAGANQNPQPSAQTGVFNNNSNGAFGNNNGQNANALGVAGQGNNVMGGGIAGVASKTTGRTIKVINEQKDRSLWEFVYDMQKELQANAPALGGNANANATGANGGTNSFQSSPALPPGFVSPNQTNSFGSGSGSANLNPATPPSNQ